MIKKYHSHMVWLNFNVIDGIASSKGHAAKCRRISEGYLRKLLISEEG